VLRYVGDVRHPIAHSVSGFVDKLLEDFDDDDLVFDLSDADAIDSTNLGEIARIADRLSARSGKRAAIVSTRPEISHVLFSMAFDQVFDICTGDPGKSPARDDAAKSHPSGCSTPSGVPPLRVFRSGSQRLEAAPAGDRQAYEKLVAEAGEPAWLDEARRLDALLDEAPDIAPSPALLRRVAEIPARHATGASGWIWPLGRLRTLVALGAMAAAMGLVVGMTTTESAASDDGGEEWDDLSALALGTNVSEEVVP
jgi:anti-anti-sigma regulatory factor